MTCWSVEESSYPKDESKITKDVDMDVYARYIKSDKIRNEKIQDKVDMSA